jgi:hypothetical protein
VRRRLPPTRGTTGIATVTRAACCGARRVLLWGHGIGGFVGTALLEARGSPYLYQHDDFRSIS